MTWASRASTLGRFFGNLENLLVVTHLAEENFLKHKSRNPAGHIRLSGVLMISIVLSVLVISHGGAQKLNLDPGHKEYLLVNGIKFSSPNGFGTQLLKTDEEVAYVPHQKYDLGLLVAVPGKPIDGDYIGWLASLAALNMFPNEKPSYSWKKLEGYQRVSKYEVGGGMLQGFNGHQRVLMQYRQIKVNGKDVVVAYTFGLGRGSETKLLFDRNLGGDSMPGWYAQAHIIASITGEKYDDINPGTGINIITAPPPRRKN